MFGSVARGEVTSGSDLDWILLVDGPAYLEHREQQREIESLIHTNHFGQPGRTGVFGSMVGSHDLVHNIGGEDDLNSNTTRRVLLLLESWPVTGTREYRGVRRQIIRRYVEDDRGLLYSTGPLRVPRFLLNDLTRYWRTVTVDFVYKQTAGNNARWALRNAKLRMSRKLVFAAGLMHCFLCQLDPAAETARLRLRADSPDTSGMVEYLEARFQVSTLDTLAEACILLGVSAATCRALFDSYDRFLGILDDGRLRQQLADAADPAALRGSELWHEVSDISNRFADALVSLFLSDVAELSQLTRRYAIF